MGYSNFSGGVSFAKRIFDTTASILALITLSPFLLLIAILLVIYQGWPILYIQRRPGYKGIPFDLLKFRTMRPAHAGEEGTAHDGHRLTGIGRFLRSYSLDELPELWNILRGEMSLVGPRPLLMQYLPLYTKEQNRRHDVLPGLTGWAQIHGRNALSWEDKFIMDVWYVDHYSFWLDLKIIMLTIWKVLKREGISQEGEATMQEWKGD